jgi:hypothetical protein
MQEETVRFTGDGRRLAGTIRLPDGMAPGEKRPGFVVLHGFGGNRKSPNVLASCALYERLGYVTLRFDMPGCGESEGESGRVICLEQVEATKGAISFLRTHPRIDAERIALSGSSFGAAVSVYTGAKDKRVAAVVASSGWGNGERKFRGQHPTPEAWARFTAMLEEGKRHRERTGTSLMVQRYEIVPIPERLRAHRRHGDVEMFPAEVPQSMFDFKAEEVVAEIAPRPLLLMHSSNDSVTPTEQSVELFKRAGQPTDLHLFSETDHFMLSENNLRVIRVLEDWLAKYFPARAPAEVA